MCLLTWLILELFLHGGTSKRQILLGKSLIGLSLMVTGCAFSLSLLPSSKLVEFLIMPDVLFSCLRIERRCGSLSDFSII